ncbi:MAG TPA: valine--tRNA ligase, partial [Gaiellaceae bacterium]
MELATLYNPHGVEERWQRVWEEERLYHADPEQPGETYVIAVPPPNVTGALHMGHALNGSIQDALIRHHRMRGFNTLWQPGFDHAGIATQAVVERELRAQGTSRLEIGREQFVERVWEWLHEYGGVIMSQFRRLGCSLDYERERFTMDDGYVRAVMRFFVHLYERGWLFRDNRIVNWCTDCRTSISDLEVEYLDVDDALTYASYPLVNGEGSISIATARPATILADVAVAVHPDDERYTALIGKEVKVPVVERTVPVIADERVDPAFGTGAVKITPGHDPMDFEIGRDHGLEELTVIDLEGRMTGDVPDGYRGLTEDEAAERVVQWLKDNGQLEKREHYRHSVGHCERSGTRIQPLVSLQWWCDMQPMAAAAIDAIESGRVTFHPPAQNRVALEWLKNIRPWNVSRQLWWGHQLPIWYCPDGHVTCAIGDPSACAECGSTALQRDEDVLDTWFSSALWPFATLGWPDDTPELRRYYPGDVNSTAREIIFLWEARMVMAGLELVGDIPFSDVIIHSTVLAPDGRRMSKSLGTGIDPVELIEQHGADATRYGLLKMSSTQDVRFSAQQIEEGRRLANKLWNASRLLLMNGGDR